MIPAVLGLLGSSAGVYIMLGLAVLWVLGAIAWFSYRSGRNAAQVATDRVTAKADAAKVSAEANAWKAGMGVPSDPVVLLRKHEL